MIELEFVGAAQQVTGSMHLVRTAHATVLLDCGLYQGRRDESFERNRHLPLDVSKIDVVVLSHAHIDHSGALPLLMKQGYDGPIFTTPATRDLCAAMLEDAAMIQAADARHLNKVRERDGEPGPHIDPLYGEADVVRTLSHMVSLPYHQQLVIAKGVRLSFLDAGHVLGSAICVLDIDDAGVEKRLCFTGDLGRKNMPILRDPEIPTGVHALITESTYGDRNHAPIQEMDEALATVIERTFKRGGKVVIPSFALERAQEIVFALKKMSQRGRLPKVPIYVDSPLTVKITDVFKLHPECYDAETRALLRKDSPFDFESLRYVSDKDESKAIDASPEPCVIISASGMCESGRVLHHLKATLEDERHTVVIVGFQAQHTLGRRLVEKRARVRIFGVERDRRADVVVLNGFSAHADQRELMEFAVATRDQGKLQQVVMVHGEPKAQKVFSEKLTAQGFAKVAAPVQGQKIEI